MKPFSSVKGSSPDAVAIPVTPRPKDYESSLVALNDAYETISKLNKELSQQKAKIRQMELYIEEHEPLDINSSTPTAACGVGWMLDRSGRRSRIDNLQVTSPNVQYGSDSTFNIAIPAVAIPSDDSAVPTPLTSSVSCTSNASPRFTPKNANVSSEQHFERSSSPWVAAQSLPSKKGIAHNDGSAAGVTRSASFGESDLSILVDSSTPKLISQSTKQSSQIPKSMVNKLSSTVNEVRISGIGSPGTDEPLSPDTSVGTVPSLLIRQKSTEKLKMISKKYRASSYDTVDAMQVEEVESFAPSSMLNSKSSVNVVANEAFAEASTSPVVPVSSPMGRTGVGRRQLLGRVEASKTMISLTAVMDAEAKHRGDVGSNVGGRRSVDLPRAASTSTMAISSPSHTAGAGVATPTAASSSLSKWDWKTSKGVFLFIYHDNPQLGNTVSMSIRCKDSASGSSKDTAVTAIGKAAVPMDIMIETKEPTGQSFFLIGEIVFSGAIQLIEGCGDNSNSPRGSSCMVCTNLKAVKSNLKSFPTRNAANSTEIIEFDMSGGPSAVVDIQSNEQLVQCLSGCSSRVDVILDPYHTGTWYPYWEGTRKMAPQFRSRGIGYLRLGDDMSQFGIGFMSLDAGYSYLDAGACGGLQDANTVDSSSALAACASVKEGHQQSVSPSLDLCGTGNRQFFVIVQDVKDLLSKLSTNMESKDNRWQERVQLFNSLSSALLESKEVENKTVTASSSLNREVSTVLLECITKQKNPHALKSIVECVKSAGVSGKLDVANNSLIWRSLFLEVIALLRSTNKLVVEAAKDMLDTLFLDSHEPLGGEELTAVAVKEPLSPVIGCSKSQTKLQLPQGSQNGGTSTASTNVFLNYSGCSLHFIISLLPEVFKCVPRASNPCKILHWLSSICRREIRYVHDVMCDGCISAWSPSTNADHHVILFGLCKGFIAHKDATAREAAIELMCCVLTLDLMVTNTSETSTCDRKEMVLVNFPTYLSPAISEVYSQVLSTVKNVNDKFVKGVGMLLQDHASNGLLDYRPKVLVDGAATTEAVARVDGQHVTANKPPDNSTCDPEAAKDVRGSRFREEDRRKGSLNILSNAWFEIRLTLKRIPTTNADWNYSMKVSNEAAQFFNDLTRIADEQCKMPRAALLREILPFDENTSSNDQSVVSQDTDFNHLVETSLGDRSKERQEKIGYLIVLQRQAINIRKMIRVKMADESDLKQAQETLSMIGRFGANLQTHCDQFHGADDPVDQTHQFDIVKSLEEEYR